MLESIHQCHIRPESDVYFKKLDHGTRRFAFRVEATILFCLIRGGDQFHAHGSDLRKLCRQIDFTTLIEVYMGALELMEGMSAFMQDRLYIPRCVGVAHKNKWAVRNMQAQAICTRSLILATFKIKQIFIHHDLETFPEFWIHLFKDGARFRLKFIHGFVRLDGSSS